MSDRSELGMSNATSVGMPGVDTIRSMGTGPPDIGHVEVGLGTKHPIKQQAQMSGQKLKPDQKFYPQYDAGNSPYSPGQRLQENTMSGSGIPSAILMNVG